MVSSTAETLREPHTASLTSRETSTVSLSSSRRGTGTVSPTSRGTGTVSRRSPCGPPSRTRPGRTRGERLRPRPTGATPRPGGMRSTPPGRRRRRGTGTARWLRSHRGTLMVSSTAETLREPLTASLTSRETGTVSRRSRRRGTGTVILSRLRLGTGSARSRLQR